MLSDARYTIPGINGALDEGSRIWNWAWYSKYPDGSPELHELMTDNEGNRHRFSVPPGKMSAHVWAKQQTLAAETLPPMFAELVSKTAQPFIQLITDVIASRASFLDGKVLLVGDALAGFRPHVFASTNQAARGALSLKDVMVGELSWADWEDRALRYAREMYQAGIGLGRKIMFPDEPEAVL